MLYNNYDFRASIPVTAKLYCMISTTPVWCFSVYPWNIFIALEYCLAQMQNIVTVDGYDGIKALLMLP